MGLKHGADGDKLKYVVRRTWLSKELFMKFGMYRHERV